MRKRLFGLAPRYELAADDDPSFGEIDLLADLHHSIPAGPLHSGTDELGADVAFAEVLLVHPATCLCPVQVPSAFPQSFRMRERRRRSSRPYAGSPFPVLPEGSRAARGGGFPAAPDRNAPSRKDRKSAYVSPRPQGV